MIDSMQVAIGVGTLFVAGVTYFQTRFSSLVTRINTIQDGMVVEERLNSEKLSEIKEVLTRIEVDMAKNYAGKRLVDDLLTDIMQLRAVQEGLKMGMENLKERFIEEKRSQNENKKS